MTVKQNPTREVWLEIFKKKQMLTEDFGHDANSCAEVICSSFGITTYDSAVDALFSETIVQVLEVIRDKTTFEYIKEHDKYLKYLVVVNYPMIHDILNWGGSIRGAWFDLGDRYGLDSKISKIQLQDFISCSDVPDSDYPEVNTDAGMVELVYALRAFLCSSGTQGVVDTTPPSLSEPDKPRSK